MRNFTIHFSRYNKNTATGIKSAPVFVTAHDINEAFNIANAQILGMRAADTVSDFKVVSVAGDWIGDQADGYVYDIFRVDQDDETEAE